MNCKCYIIVCGMLCYMGCHTPEEYLPWTLERAEQINFYPIAYDDYVILPSKCEEEECITCLKAQTGKIQWQISNPLFSKIYYNFQPYIFDHKLVLPIGNTILVLSLHTGEELWAYSHPFSGESYAYGSDEKVYRTYTNIEEAYTEILEFDLEEYTFKKVFSKQFGSGYKVLFRSPVPGTYANQFWLLSNYIAYRPPEDTRSALVLIKGVDSSNVEYLPLKHLAHQGRGAAISPVVKEGLAYWQVDTLLMAVDLQSRAIKWSYSIPIGLLTSKIIVDQQRVYIPAENKTLYALDRLSGKEIWTQSIGGTPGRMQLRENHIWLVGGSDQTLYRIHKTSGEISHRFKSSNSVLPLTRQILAKENFILLSNQTSWFSCNPYESEEVVVLH